MGFPSGYTYSYTKELLPNLLVKATSLFRFLKMFVISILNFLGLTHYIEPSIHWPEPGFESKSISAALIQEILPVMKYAEVGSGPDQPENCAVCLHELRNQEEIRRLINCKHIFHRGCVDHWMEHDQRSCPLCRTSFVPDHLVELFNERLEAASSSFPEFGSEFSIINTFL